MMVVTKQHLWVKITITPVAVIENGKGNPVIFVDPDQVFLAEETSAYGCQICDEPLYPNNANTECQGEQL